jgi:hypothetical protein
MSKFVCRCGNIISDVRYPSGASSTMLSEAALRQFLSFAGKFVTDLKRAGSEGRRTEWISSQFGEGYVLDASDSEITEDALSKELVTVAVSVTRCDSCDRIHIQREPGSNEYQSFTKDVG